MKDIKKYNYAAAFVHIFPFFQKRIKPFLDIIADVVSKFQASGWAFPLAAVD